MTLPDGTPGYDPEAFKNWTPEAQAQALEMLKQQQDGRRIWFCRRGRKCDGKAHDGANYPHARADQWPPPGLDWFVWLVISGRGAGKTKTGSEWLRKMSEHVERAAMIGRRGVDVRQTMVEGDSGLIRACERAKVPYEWAPSKREFTFHNGAKVFGYSGEEPDSLRGPQHGIAWLDEPAHIAQIQDVWDNLLMGLRLDGVPGGSKVLCTSTPLPTKWLKALIADPLTRTVRVSTYANLDNLDPNFRRTVIARYEGTRLGRQELHGEVLADVEGALWNFDMIVPYRIGSRLPDGTPEPLERLIPQMDRIVIGLDPAGTSKKRSDETGIVVVGRSGGEFYVLADHSGKYTPSGWARKAADLYEHWQANAIVAENNYGGEMVKSTLQNERVTAYVKEVNSRRGKLIRAEPVVSLYEQGLVHHAATLESVAEGLEEQMTEWIPGKGDSPDRVDALVHALTDLASDRGESEIATATGIIVPPSHGGLGRRRQGALAALQARPTRPTVRSWS